LDKITLHIRPGEKVGVVGRTGAGKSSMMLAICRLVEGAGGTITIDGVDTGKIGLHDLRSKLAIIPQDPILYSGTIRFNLDPFNTYSNEALWTALGQAQMKGWVENLPKQLDNVVTEGGDNLSVGKRCQMCLARAILRHSHVLILDEATASVDMETDAAIQRSIRRDFNNCTIVTIAHRLNTVVDYDRVVVMSFGRVIEFDTPATLLRNPQSMLSSMVDETGAAQAALLRSIAFDKEASSAAKTTTATLPAS